MEPAAKRAANDVIRGTILNRQSFSHTVPQTYYLQFDCPNGTNNQRVCLRLARALPRAYRSLEVRNS